RGVVPVPLPPSGAGEHDGPAGPGERAPAADLGRRRAADGGDAGAFGRVTGPRTGRRVETARRPVPPPRRTGDAAPRRDEGQRPGERRTHAPAAQRDGQRRGDRLRHRTRFVMENRRMKFSYSSGSRPLDGYTLKRGIGRGGFGEVYFAISDGGKEVALKLLRDNQEVELRGVAQCLNLKHPNLVALYDMRTDPRGDHWVIMEYV